MAALARTEFSSALNAIANERGLDPSIILDTIKQAIVAAYKRDARERGEIGEDEEGVFFDASIDPESGEARIFTWKEGEEDKKVDITPPGFGRIAAQTAKQVMVQKIREAEKSAVMSQYKGRVGSLISGIVLRFDGPNVRVDLGRAEGIMPPQERIPNERLSLNQRLTFLLKEIVEGERGPEIILSRADPEIVKKLFAREVPEIGSGSVEIRAIAREAGSRTKVAVFSTQSGVDPVGSCVGQKGVRVQAVITELNGEKIDVIPWTEDLSELVISSLAPASGASVVLDEENKSAKVTIPEDQLSLAIGKGGQNVQLASKLTGLKIEIEGAPVAEKEEAEKEGTTGSKGTTSTTSPDTP
ncbi:MAG: transcription termination/antitermination protein NusA [Candidatus Blackburnbacteria bacterium]|nr:transcription termination/antitermination protein NusA [Candidatus Blackburnbacteria bacterium]